jgi:hypothetical protein
VKQTWPTCFLNRRLTISLPKWGWRCWMWRDVMRPYPEVIAFLQQVKDDQYLEELEQFHGGQEARDAIHAYLDNLVLAHVSSSY